MTWKSLLDDGRVETHVTSKAELDDLRAAIARNLGDAAESAMTWSTTYKESFQVPTQQRCWKRPESSTSPSKAGSARIIRT